ncbi:MAG: hypothetical protein ACE5I1_01095 [bacterium]
MKIAGKTTANGGFLAVEIVLEPAETSPKLEGEIQEINQVSRKIRTFNRELTIENSIEIKDLHENIVDLSDVKVGSILKIKGKYVNGHGFVPKKIKIKQGREFNIEETQGFLESIDLQKQSLDINGITVFVNKKTIYQAG